MLRGNIFYSKLKITLNNTIPLFTYQMKDDKNLPTVWIEKSYCPFLSCEENFRNFLWKNIVASLLSPLRVDMFLHLAKLKSVFVLVWLKNKVPGKMIKKLGLMIFIFLSSINDSPPICNIYINVAVTLTGDSSRKRNCRYTGHGTSSLWEWCQNKGSHG